MKLRVRNCISLGCHFGSPDSKHELTQDKARYDPIRNCYGADAKPARSKLRISSREARALCNVTLIGNARSKK